MTLTLLLIVLVLFVVQGLYRNHDGTFDGVPPHLDSIEKWTGTDNDTWYARWTIYFTGWQAFGPWSKYSWAKWRSVPKDLLRLNDGSPWRVETDQLSGLRYTSRVQYWSRWHLLLQWPLSLSFHWYWRAKDVPPKYEWPEDFNISQLVYGYGPIHFDADSVYWLFSFYFGGEWK